MRRRVDLSGHDDGPAEETRRRQEGIRDHKGSPQMRKIIPFGAAVALTVLAVMTWATATPHSKHQRASAALSSPISPLELMRSSQELPSHRYGEPF
jgi:hypothetical protein